MADEPIEAHRDQRRGVANTILQRASYDLEGQGLCIDRSVKGHYCQTAWKNGQGIRENSVENCPP